MKVHPRMFDPQERQTRAILTGRMVLTRSAILRRPQVYVEEIRVDWMHPLFMVDSAEIRAHLKRAKYKQLDEWEVTWRPMRWADARILKLKRATI